MAEQNRRRVFIADYFNGDYTAVTCTEFHPLMVSRHAARTLLDLMVRTFVGFQKSCFAVWVDRKTTPNLGELMCAELDLLRTTAAKL
jgi:hypothetical protein